MDWKGRDGYGGGGEEGRSQKGCGSMMGEERWRWKWRGGLYK